MAQLLVILTVFAIISSVVSQNSALYPNWSCNKGYEPQTYSDESGSGRVNYVMRYCGDQHKINSPCYQFCIMESHGIFKSSLESPTFSTEAEMASRLEMFIFDKEDNDSAEKIAKSILSKCGALGKGFEKKNCSEGSKLYKCVESAWMGCGK